MRNTEFRSAFQCREALNFIHMYINSIHQTVLMVPQGMNRLHLNQSDNVKGGKRREGAFLNRAVYGILAGMIVPGGFIVAFF